MPSITRVHRLYRQFDVNQTIYKELLNRRLEFSLMEASTLANLKIVDNAYSYAKISPRGFQSIVIFTLFGLMLGIIYALIRNIFFLPIKLPSHILEEFPDLTTLGIIPDDQQLMKIPFLHLHMKSLNSLATNMLVFKESQNEDAKVISRWPNKKVGKTYMNFNLASFK